MSIPVNYLVISIVFFVIGLIVGYLVNHYISKKVIEEWKRKMEKPDKDQVRNMLSALGQKPSEEQINRFINIASRSEKKKAKDRKENLKKKK